MYTADIHDFSIPFLYILMITTSVSYKSARPYGTFNVIKICFPMSQ